MVCVFTTRRALRPALWALVLAALAPASSARAKSDIRVEVAPGVAVPIGPYLRTRGPGLSQSIESGVGFGMGLHLVLDGWEVRYALSVLPTHSARIELSPGVVSDWNRVAADSGLAGDLISPNLPSGGVRVDTDAGAIRIHHVNFGYRIPLTSGDFSVWIPVGLGISVTTGPSDLLGRDLWGLSANTGVGVTYAVFPWLELGGSARYLLTISEADANLALLARLAQVGASRSLIDDSYNIGHLLHITASAAIRF